jgi:hypothetical protein
MIDMWIGMKRKFPNGREITNEKKINFSPFSDNDTGKKGAGIWTSVSHHI